MVLMVMWPDPDIIPSAARGPIIPGRGQIAHMGHVRWSRGRRAGEKRHVRLLGVRLEPDVLHLVDRTVQEMSITRI